MDRRTAPARAKIMYLNRAYACIVRQETSQRSTAIKGVTMWLLSMNWGVTSWDECQNDRVRVMWQTYRLQQNHQEKMKWRQTSDWGIISEDKCQNVRVRVLWQTCSKTCQEECEAGTSRIIGIFKYSEWDTWTAKWKSCDKLTTRPLRCVEAGGYESKTSRGQKRGRSRAKSKSQLLIKMYSIVIWLARKPCLKAGGETYPSGTIRQRSVFLI